MRVRVAVVVAGFLVALIAIAATAGARIQVDEISFWFSGTAFQTSDSYATTAALGYHLVDHETTTVTFESSCAFDIEAARVRPGEPLLCQSGKWATVLGRIEDENPDDPARNCVGTIRFRPKATFYLGGTLASPDRIRTETGAPFAPFQLVANSSNPLVDACSSLSLESPGGGHSFNVNDDLTFPSGRVGNSWHDNLGTDATPVHVMFSAKLTVDTKSYTLSRGYEIILGAIAGQLEQWWNAAANAAGNAIPPSFTIEIPAAGTLHATWTPAAAAGRGPLRRTAHSAAAGPLFTVDQQVHAGRNVVAPRLTALGRAVLAGSVNVPVLRSTMTFTPSGGSATTVTGTFTPLVAPAISSVQFSGTPADPTIVVRGRGLAPLPPRSPSGTPAGHNGCPSQSGNQGFDYGTQLNVNDLSKGWAAGLSVTNNTDCIGLIATTVTPSELILRLGSFYTSLFPKFTLASGDEVQVVANGAPIDVHVSYGAAVTK